MTASSTQFHCRAEVKTAPKGRVTPKILSKLHGLCSVRKHTKHSDQNHLLKQVLVIVLDPDRVLSARCFSDQKVIKHLLKPFSRLQKVLQKFCSIETFAQTFAQGKNRISGTKFWSFQKFCSIFCSARRKLAGSFAGWKVRLPIKQATLKVICYPLWPFCRFG